MSAIKKSALKREEFLRGTAGFAAAGTGMGLLVPSALARGKVKKGGVLRFAYTETAASSTTDPTVTTNSLAGVAVCNNYERLTYVVPNTWQVLPQLATSWKASPDAKRWTFKLQKGVKFHNGKTLDSKDVKWSYSHILDKKNGSNYYAELSAQLDPSGILTPRADTVVFKLKKANALFPLFAGGNAAAIYPAGVDPKKQPIGTGPFMIKSFRPTQRVELVRNPDYWRPGLPYLDGVQMVYIADSTTKVQAVVSGSAHLSDRIGFEQVASIKKNSKLRLYVLPGGSFPVYTFDLLQEPFTDPRVAQAIKFAANRAVLRRTAIQNNGTLTGDVPELPNDPFYPPQRGVPGPEIARAKQLLAAAGHRNGLAFTLHTADVYPGLVAMTTALKQVVAPAGIDITISKDPGDTYFSNVWLKASAVTSYWLHRHPFPSLQLMYRSSAEWNESHYKSSRLDQLTDAGGATLNPAKQRAIFRTALNMVATQSGVGIPYIINITHVAKKNVIGFSPDQNAVSFGKVWLA